VREADARTRALWALIATAAVLTVVLAWQVARHLTADARRSTESYARIFRGLTDPREGAGTEALLALAAAIRAEGIPLVVTDPRGVATDTANLPRPLALDSPELRAFVASLDRVNPPVVEPGVGTIHFGAPPVRRQLRLVFALLVVALLAMLGTAWIAHRAGVRGSQDRVFVAMARESAHQLGTPLSSLAGWIEVLRGSTDGGSRDVAEHLAADWRRLERVARRFERIGQPPRQEPVDLGALATAAVAYFRPRLPTLANPVTMDVQVRSTAPVVAGDALLLEWALEALVKNAVDALKGRPGTISLTVRDEPEDVVLTVADDGPGVPAGLADDLFEAGVSTKTGGWGLGLALTRRIVEEGHGGRVTLEPVPSGACFAIRLPRREGA
jgi:signal transduction histidine kinase